MDRHTVRYDALRRSAACRVNLRFIEVDLGLCQFFTVDAWSFSHVVPCVYNNRRGRFFLRFPDCFSNPRELEQHRLPAVQNLPS